MVTVLKLIVLKIEGGAAEKISERLIDHAGKDVHSHLFKHAVKNEREVCY